MHINTYTYIYTYIHIHIYTYRGKKLGWEKLWTQKNCKGHIKTYVRNMKSENFHPKLLHPKPPGITCTISII